MEEVYKGYTIQIKIDEDPIDPREDSNLGVIYAQHRDYKLGDKELRDEFSEYASSEEIEEELRKQGAVIIASLYLYDHSGLRIKIGSFQGLLPQGHVEFDSGQVGFIVAFAKDIREWYQVKRITKKTLEKARAMLENEVSTYDSYLSGSVYGFIIEKDGESLDSVWGFYETDEAINEAKTQVDYLVKEAEEKKEAKVKAYIKNRVPLDYRVA